MNNELVIYSEINRNVTNAVIYIKGIDINWSTPNVEGYSVDLSY